MANLLRERDSIHMVRSIIKQLSLQEVTPLGGIN